jgi:hypothetical protein
MEMADKDASLEKFRGVMPSRAKLAQLSLFGTTEEARLSAQALLDVLPEMTVNERGEYMTETWRLANTLTEEDMEKSPAGRATLELIRNSKSMSGEIKERMKDAAPESPATDAQATQEPTPETSAETPNEYMSRLAWPPRSTKIDTPPEDEVPRKWQAAQPSKPDTSQRPISDWDSDAREPLY